MRKLLIDDVGVTAGTGILRIDAIQMVSDEIVVTTTKKQRFELSDDDQEWEGQRRSSYKVCSWRRRHSSVSSLGVAHTFCNPGSLGIGLITYME